MIIPYNFLSEPGWGEWPGLLLDGIGQYDLQINMTYNWVIANYSGSSLDWLQLQGLCLPHLDTDWVSVCRLPTSSMELPRVDDRVFFLNEVFLQY